jgi:hypothetical protein
MYVSVSRLIEYIMQSYNSKEYQIESKKTGLQEETRQYLEPFRTVHYQAPKCKHIEKQTVRYCKHTEKCSGYKLCVPLPFSATST